MRITDLHVKFHSRIKKVLGAFGLGGMLLASCVGYPVGQALSYGHDHFRRAWHEQLYFLENVFTNVGPDEVILYSCDWVTVGNIVTLQNQENSGDTTARSVANLRVHSVTFEGQNTLIPEGVGSISIPTSYGSFIIFRSGFYTYISSQTLIEPFQSENISIHLRNEQGLEQEVSLFVRAYRVSETANQMADYGNQVNGPNAEFLGNDAYQTAMPDGAMVFGWEDADILMGSAASDAIFGWHGIDNIFGFDGNDVLAGEHDGDQLHGGRGADVFLIYSSDAIRGDVDVVHDFSLQEGDVINLRPVISADEWNDLAEQDDAEILYSSFVRVSFEADYVDILVDPHGTGEAFQSVVRLMYHDGLTMSDVSIADWIQRGVLLVGH
ncbi:calcium-binding protein [Rhodophyticola sp. CCM32]|uniref:type I secretion C-terminal target domain-containing protein n=1 Tax=Rhodophyticola sp. CCM32 TaxID=2916397 RepID=UPI00107F5405|nr:calcium-binding protein [Rhodophyticola sp. CCM32]QBX99863.1 calcium-binding protein [Rhodophyticola sp. CCM32]